MEPQIYPILNHQIAIYQNNLDAPAIVLCHGNSTSSRIFQKQFAGELAQKFRLVAFDYPGHGRSANAANPQDYSLPGLADVLVEIVSQLKLENATFIGFSLGGHVVLEASSRLPQAKGFMIYGAPPVGKPPAMEQAFLPHPSMNVLFKGVLTPEEAELLESASFIPGTPPPPQFVEDCLRADPQWRGSFGGSIMQGRYLDEIEIVHTLRRPLAVLQGQHEQLINLDYLRSLSMPTLWRGAVQVVPDTGHALHWEAPQAFAALAQAFAEG